MTGGGFANPPRASQGSITKLPGSDCQIRTLWAGDLPIPRERHKEVSQSYPVRIAKSEPCGRGIWQSPRERHKGASQSCSVRIAKSEP